MNLQKSFLLLIAATILLTTAPIARSKTTQAGKLYQKMTMQERSEFVATQARRIAREMSGNEYEFTPAFEEDIQQAVTYYARRIGKRDDQPETRSMRLVLERGQVQAATLMTAFRTRDVSPLIGLYLPFIESEYINIESPNSMGAIGMFQFLPQTGENYGLSRQDLLDVTKSADAAARYIQDSIDQFKSDPMKEALALLAYNRGGHRTARDLKFLVKEENRKCSICALSADRSKLDETFRYESVFYVPRFFAAAIIGENPQVFGLGMQPLSSYETQRTW
jgi:hypothetical protein